MKRSSSGTVDIVMLGSFGVWTRGTLQSRALPLARALAASTGLRLAIVTTPWDDPDEAGRAEKIDGVSIFNTRSIEPRFTALAVAEQLQIVRDLSPNLVHVMKPKAYAGLTGQALGLTTKRMPIIVDHDDWEGDGGWNDRASYSVAQRRLFDFQERRLLVNADAVTAASTLLEARARRVRGHRENDMITFLPNGLEAGWINRLHHERASRAATDEPALLLYSRFAEFSADWLEYVLGKIDSMVTRPVDLHVIGYRGSGRRLFAGLEHIRPLDHGYVERKRIPQLLGQATIAIYPYDDNLINRAKQSVKLVEIMASGCAVVASDVGDIKRIGGDAVVAVSPGNADSYVDAVIGLIENPGRAAELGRLAADRAKDFDIEHLATRLLAIYGSCGLH